MAWRGAHRGNSFKSSRVFGTDYDLYVAADEEFEEEYDELSDDDLDQIEELENEYEDFLDADNDS